MPSHTLSPRRRALRAGSIALTATLTLAACGGTDEGGGSADEGKVQVASGFFPLSELARAVGGDHVEVTQLTPDGSDPHHLEMTPQATGRLQEADLVLHLRTMQPALDAAVEAVAADRAWDAGEAVDLEAGPRTGKAEESGHEGHDHAAEAEAGHDGHDHGGVDPHFWLDPVAFGEAATSLGDALAERDPEHAEDYRRNAQEYVHQLEELDDDLAQQLGHCRSTDLVVGHEAYAWFGARYGFHQLGVAGLSNEAEVSPARLAELTDTIKKSGVSTIYAEPLAPRDNARTLADETGTTVEVLDPAAGLTDSSAARDYLGIMRHNGEVLHTGQGCE